MGKLKIFFQQARDKLQKFVKNSGTSNIMDAVMHVQGLNSTNAE